MVKRFEYDFGSGEYHPNFVIFESARGVDIDENMAKTVLENCKEFYGDKPYGLISCRNDIRSVRSPRHYKQVKPKELIAIAVVSEDSGPTPNIIEEQQLYDGPFSFFRHVDQARRWMESFFDELSIDKPIKINHSFGEGFCHKDHVIFTAYENTHIGKKQFRLLAKELEEIYNKDSFAFIVDRKNKYTVDPAVYRLINKQPILGFGIIGTRLDETHLMESLEVLKMPVGYFSTAIEAASWVETLE